MRFDRWTVLLFIRRKDRPALEPRAAEELQDAHLAYLALLHSNGPLVAAGPIDPAPGSDLAGVCVYRTDCEETGKLAGQDPAVRAGVFRTELYAWSVPEGTISFPPSVFPRSMDEAGAP